MKGGNSMIRVSHEMPMYLLRNGYEEKYNDYGYALVHLFEENKEYYNYYVNSLKKGRTVYLDNSIFELGKAFNVNRFVYWLNKLANDSQSDNIVYIIPDVLDNTQQTITSVKSFIDKYRDLPGEKMAVLQGSSFKDLLMCYNSYKEFNIIDLYGIPFISKAYEKSLPYVKNDLLKWKVGRRSFVKMLSLYDPDLKENSLHLLGCALPDEYKYYTIYESQLEKYIYSLDTSNPIVHGLLGIKYKDDFGLRTKRFIKLVDLLNVPNPSKEINDIINYNVKMFRKINNLHEIKE